MPEIKHLGAQIAVGFDELRGVSHTDSLLPAMAHIPGGPMFVQYAGHERAADVGYRQSGMTTGVRDGIII